MNVSSGGYDWFGTEYAPDPAQRHFCSAYGYQGDFDKDDRWYAMAVRPGDVAASMPEPQTLAPMALGATLVVRRRRPA